MGYFGVIGRVVYLATIILSMKTPHVLIHGNFAIRLIRARLLRTVKISVIEVLVLLLLRGPAAHTQIRDRVFIILVYIQGLWTQILNIPLEEGKVRYCHLQNSTTIHPVYVYKKYPYLYQQHAICASKRR
jgi:hypothetical protein